jgi:hypothetical protein
MKPKRPVIAGGKEVGPWWIQIIEPHKLVKDKCPGAAIVPFSVRNAVCIRTRQDRRRDAARPTKPFDWPALAEQKWSEAFKARTSDGTIGPWDGDYRPINRSAGRKVWVLKQEGALAQRGKQSVYAGLRP